MKDYEQRATTIIMNTIEGVKAQIRKAYNKGYEAGKADTPFTDTEEAENKAYNRGLNDAWETARKIIVPISEGGYSFGALDKIFGVPTVRTVFELNNASEAITKIKTYEDKQKQDDWRDIPSDEMTLEQARRAVKELRAEVLKELRGAE